MRIRNEINKEFINNQLTIKLENNKTQDKRTKEIEGNKIKNEKIIINNK